MTSEVSQSPGLLATVAAFPTTSLLLASSPAQMNSNSLLSSSEDSNPETQRHRDQRGRCCPYHFKHSNWSGSLSMWVWTQTGEWIRGLEAHKENKTFQCSLPFLDSKASILWTQQLSWSSHRLPTKVTAIAKFTSAVPGIFLWHWVPHFFIDAGSVL